MATKSYWSMRKFKLLVTYGVSKLPFVVYSLPAYVRKSLFKCWILWVGKGKLLAHTFPSI